MAKPQGVIPSPESWGKLVRTVRHVGQHKPIRKARRMPRRRNVGGRQPECACLTVHEIATDGIVSGGTFDLDVEIREEDATVTAETISSIDYDVDAADLLTALLTHSKINSGDIGVRGGPFPDAALYIVYRTTGDLNRHQEVPVPDSSSITGGGVVKATQVTSADWELGL